MSAFPHARWKHSFNPPGPWPGASWLRTAMPWLASPMSGFPLGTASAHRMGSGIVTQTLSPPEDLREGWTSPRTSQRCLKMESSLIGLKSDLVPHGSPLIGPRVQTTAAFAAWVSACVSQEAGHHRVGPSGLCLCRLSSKDPASYWIGLDTHLGSSTLRPGGFAGGVGMEQPSH